MSNPILNLNKPSASLFDGHLYYGSSFDNLFVVTHLGQLKQMEALIASRDITNNCLVVLYTQKNLIVPQMVHDQYSLNFDQAIFLEIPFGANKVHLTKLRNLKRKYQKLIDIFQPKSLYLNSFEGHYALLTSIVKQQGIETILVEEGTATYKLNLKKMVVNKPKDTIDYDFIKSKFMATVGQTQIFKKLVKMRKYNKDLYRQSKKFVKEVAIDEKVQRQLIKLSGDSHLKSSLEPFKAFDKAYASFPNLIKEGFGINNVDYFLVHEVANERANQEALDVIDKYNITKNDILFVSQRYHLNSEQYAKAVAAILTRIAESNQRVFIKLHPKEDKKTYDSFKYLEFVSNKKFIVIEESQFLIESVVKVSKIRQLIGLTSTTLVYGPLVSANTRSISIAAELCSILPKTSKNLEGIKVINEHLKIIKIFDNIEFR